MPPSLALLLCTVFVFFMLRLERKQAPEVSRALWIPTIWMLSIASKPLGVWFPSEGRSFEAGSPLDRYFLIGIILVGFIVLIIRRFDWSRAIKENTWLMLLFGYMLVSILWSDIFFISFKRWTRELVAVLMAFLLLTEASPRQALESILRRSVYILIPFSVLLIKYFPQYGVEYGRWSGKLMWIGVTMQKNGLGRLCLIVTFFIIWTFVRRWRGRDIPVGKFQTYAEVFLLIGTLVLMKGPPGSYSATALGTVAVGLIAFIGLLWMKKRQTTLKTNIFVATLALGIAFGIVTVFVGSTLESFTSILGRDETLTGRTEVWAKLLPVAMRQPILGCGFGGFWTYTTREEYAISEGHSGYLDILLELGFVGLLLVSMFLLSCSRKAQRELAHDFDWASLWICYLLMAVFHNVTESSLNSFTTQLTAVVLFFAVSSTAARSNIQRVSQEV